MLVNFLILIFFILIFLLSIKDKKKSKDLFYNFFIYIATYIYYKIKKTKIIKKNDTSKNIDILNPGIKTEKIIDQYNIDKIYKVLILIFLFNILSFISLFSKSSSLISGNLIRRPNYGGGSKLQDIELYLISEGDGEDKHIFKDYKLDIQEQFYDKELLMKQFDMAEKYLEEVVKASNESLDKVNKDLFLPSKIPGTSIKVSWEVENPFLISSQGKIYKNNQSKESEKTYVKALMEYDDNLYEVKLDIIIVPSLISKEEELIAFLDEELSLADNESKYEEFYRLPDKINGYKLVWKDGEGYLNYKILFFAIAISIFIWLYKDYKLEVKVKEKRKQMIIDYPNIISKFTILIGAGMTINKAWQKIVEDYEKVKKSGSERFAYEEMRITSNEISVGVSEINAYEKFGRRIGILSYMKFSSLVCQNLKRGSKGFIDLLNYEAYLAFNERKEYAKVQSEEATTKLLLPILLLFLIIILVVIVPAFLSFSLI